MTTNYTGKKQSNTIFDRKLHTPQPTNYRKSTVKNNKDLSIYIHKMQTKLKK